MLATFSGQVSALVISLHSRLFQLDGYIYIYIYIFQLHVELYKMFTLPLTQSSIQQHCCTQCMCCLFVDAHFLKWFWQSQISTYVFARAVPVATTASKSQELAFDFVSFRFRRSNWKLKYIPVLLCGIWHPQFEHNTAHSIYPSTVPLLTEACKS